MAPPDTHSYTISLNSPAESHSLPPALSIPESPKIDHSHFQSPASSLAPSDSISTRSSHHSSFPSQSIAHHDPLTGIRRSISLSHLDVHTGSVWSSKRQKLFEHKLARVTAACNLLQSWVDNPEWLSFVDEFIPAARSPSRNILTCQIIHNVTENFQAQAWADSRGQLGTLQDDGWTGVNHHHLLASMVAANGKLHPITVDDVSSKRKTAEKLMEHVERAMGELESKWDIVLIAIVMDALGECHKAKKILQ